RRRGSPTDAYEAAAAKRLTNHVMVAIAREDAPSPARSLRMAFRRRSARDAGSAIWVAWHLGTVRRWTIPRRVRVRSIALVLSVACVLGTGSLAAASALRVAAEPIVRALTIGGEQARDVDVRQPEREPADGPHDDSHGAGLSTTQPAVVHRADGNHRSAPPPGADPGRSDHESGDEANDGGRTPDSGGDGEPTGSPPRPTE